MAGPKKSIDAVLLEKLCKLQLSEKIVVDCLGVSIQTLNRRYGQQMDEWRSKGKTKIAEVLYDEAINKRQGWAIQLIAKRHLDYGEIKDDDNGNRTLNVNLSYSKDKLEKAIKNANDKK